MMPTKSSRSIYLKFFIPISIICLTFLSFHFWHKNVPQSVQTIRIENQPLSIAMEFNSPEEIKPYKFLGDFNYLKKGGIKNSGCIEFKSPLVLQFSIEKEQLPIKISFRLNSKEDNPNDHTDFPLILWDSWQKLTRMSGINDVKIPIGDWGAYLEKDEDWHNETIWVTENSIDIWIGGKRVFLDMMKPASSPKNLYIVLWKNIKIDDFKLETVSTDKIPDFSRYLNINNEIPEKKVNEVVEISKYLPETKNNRLKPLLQKYKDSSPDEVLNFLNNLKTYYKKNKE
jgi:hypothetical protein